MIIEYRINKISFHSLYPEYRRKMIGWKRIFQFLFTWKTFKYLHPDNNKIYDCLNFSDLTAANEFLEKEVFPIGPIKYYKNIKEQKLKANSLSREYREYK